MGIELLIGLLACVTEAEDTGEPPVSNSPDMVFLDENNYHYTGLFDAPSVKTAQLQDLTLSWASVTQDLQCHDMDVTTEIDTLSFMLFPHLTEQEVEDGLSAGTLEQGDLQLYLSYAPEGATDALLTDLTFFGTDADIEAFYEDGNGTFLLVLATGESIGVGGRDLVFIDPDPVETNTHVEFSEGCGILDFSGDLTDLEPVAVAEAGPFTLDWTGLTTDGQGNPINTNNIDQIMVAHYDTATPAELESVFFDVELLADDLWFLDHGGGTTATLDGMTNAEGDFPGFSASGTWLLALRCTLCPNPAPLFLTVLAPG